MEKGNNNKKIYIAIILALILLAVGFYLYYFYPQIIPGMASTSLKQDLAVLVVGLDDTESVLKGEIAADSIVLAQLYTNTNELKLTNIVIDEKAFEENVDKLELERLLEEISELTSTELNYYFTLSYQGFTNLINNLGGIEIERQEELLIPDLNLDLKTGNILLSGEEALNYARWYDYRKDEKDRIERQQQVITAVVNKATKDKTLLDIPQLFNTTVDTFNSVETNIEYTLITDLIEYLMSNETPTISYDLIMENGKQ